ncbi:MAG: hypothetical protein NZ518_04665, partial [Dehalococcoidia bacterium]|nr:hypothetical protein [Dehalococcoidia bacterium]
MRPWWRLVIAGVVLAGLLASPLQPTPNAEAQARLDYAVPNGWFYTQANGHDLGKSPTGYTVSNEGGILFFDAFRFVGGVNAIGYPVSRRFVYQGFTTQVFQKAVFQWRPDQGNTIVFANIIDALGDAGRDDWLATVRQTPNRLPPSFDQGAANFQEIVRRRQALLDDNPAIKARYFAAADPISLYGLPTSRVTENSNSFVMRFQRAIIQQWKIDVPWARAGQVTVANGGDIAKEAGIFPREALEPENPPGSPAAATTPAPAQPAAPAAAAPSTPSAPSGVKYPGVGYGMQVDVGNLAYGVEMTRKAGFNWVKFQIRWENLEDTKGAIKWADIDRWVNGAPGMYILLSVVTAPSWSRPADTDRSVPGPPANPKDFADFVGALAARYKGKIHAIEVWNEQNLWYEWGGRGRRISAAQYMTL